MHIAGCRGARLKNREHDNRAIEGIAIGRRTSEVEVPFFGSGDGARNDAGRDVGAPAKESLDGIAGSAFNVGIAVIGER